MKSKHMLSKLGRRATAALVLLVLAGVVATANAAAGPSLSELLEKGIYSEETKGDLEGAMQLYQQVMAEAKSGETVAAQAQYRLGVCYYKKKNFDQANATFEKLVKDYPDQKDLVALANQYLAGAIELMPAPWADGEELRLDIKFSTGFKLGSAFYAADSAEANGQKIWRLSSHLYAGVQQVSQVEVAADSFKPIHSHWKHTLIGTADTTFGAEQAELKLAGKAGVTTIKLNGVVYDNEEAAQLLRRLPLADKYKTSLHIFTGLGGGTILPIGIEVSGPEKVEVPAGAFDCYKVELSVKQTFWCSADAHRYIVKFEGGGVIAELSAVTQRRPGTPVAYQDPVLGFALSAPADWLIHRADTKDEKGKARVMVFDPEALATGIVSVGSVKDLKPEAQKSLRDWAEQEVVEGNKTLQDLHIRSQSWKEQTVAGHPGLSVLGDYLDGKDKKVVYAMFTQGDTQAAVFTLLVGATDLETYRPKFEALVDSFKGN
jgi:hypothetical protein